MPESLRIFLVEPDDELALLVRRTLERAGHEVATCRRGADALLVVGRGDYHLALVSHDLPDRPGLELLPALKQQARSAALLLLGPDAALAAPALHAGALDYVVKDAALTFLIELPQRVRETITRHRERTLLERQLLQAQKMQSVG